MDQDNPASRLFNEGFISLYEEDVISRLSLSKEQAAALIGHLSAPEVRTYFKELSHNIVLDLMRLDFTRPDDQLKLASKYGRAHGALELLHTLVTSTERKVK